MKTPKQVKRQERRRLRRALDWAAHPERMPARVLAEVVSGLLDDCCGPDCPRRERGRCCGRGRP